jgi:hypothetical protein
MDFKKTLLIFFLFIGLNTVAQKRLEFNQVVSEDSLLTYNLGGNGNYTLYSHTLTVPPNKTWKIEFLSMNCSWLINGTQITTYIGEYIQSGAGGGAYGVSGFTGQSIWLKEGDQIKARYTGYTNGSTFYQNFYLSAIEFNIVQ